MANHHLIFQHYLTLAVAVMAMLICVNVASKEAPHRIDYFLEVAPNLTTINGRVCADNLTHNTFTLHGAIQWQTGQAMNQSPDDKINCLHYKAQLNAQKQSKMFVAQTDPTFVSGSIDELLPCPVLSKKNGLNPPRSVAINLPTGKDISLPGETIGNNLFLLNPRPCNWSSGFVLGDLHKLVLPTSSGKIEVAMPSGLTDAQQNKLSAWLKRGISALKTAYGRLPLQHFQILIFPTGANLEAVPWGQVMRGGGDSVHLYVDETKSLAELNADWVLVHELSHLLHPYLFAGDGWLAEGLASYYQNVLRARAGLLDSDQAWKKLHAGFQRGLKQFEPHMTLEKDTRKLMRERKYMRVYWGGAAIALLADVHLRSESGGVESLDKVLKKLSKCCLPTKGQRWQAKELMQQLDETAGTTIFSSLYRAYAVEAAFPSLDSAYEKLGITISGKGSLSFDSDPNSLHRRIMRSSLSAEAR